MLRLFLLCEKTFENKIFNVCEGGAKENAEDWRESCGLDTADCSEESEKANCAQHGLFDSDSRCASEESDDHANSGDDLIANVCCGDGYLCSVIMNSVMLVICVHCVTVLSDFQG